MAYFAFLSSSYFNLLLIAEIILKCVKAAESLAKNQTCMEKDSASWSPILISDYGCFWDQAGSFSTVLGSLLLLLRPFPVLLQPGRSHQQCPQSLQPGLGRCTALREAGKEEDRWVFEDKAGSDSGCRCGSAAASLLSEASCAEPSKQWQELSCSAWSRCEWTSSWPAPPTRPATVSVSRWGWGEGFAHVGGWGAPRHSSWPGERAAGVLLNNARHSIHLMPAQFANPRWPLIWHPCLSFDPWDGGKRPVLPDWGE